METILTLKGIEMIAIIIVVTLVGLRLGGGK
jgi:hypothetical protein